VTAPNFGHLMESAEDTFATYGALGILATSGTTRVVFIVFLAATAWIMIRRSV